LLIPFPFLAVRVYAVWPGAGGEDYIPPSPFHWLSLRQTATASSFFFFPLEKLLRTFVRDGKLIVLFLAVKSFFFFFLPLRRLGQGVDLLSFNKKRVVGCLFFPSLFRGPPPFPPGPPRVTSARSARDFDTLLFFRRIAPIQLFFFFFFSLAGRSPFFPCTVI